MKEILTHFRIEGTPVSCVSYGSGHINETFLENLYIEFLSKITFCSLHKDTGKFHKLLAMYLSVFYWSLEVGSDVLHHFRCDTVVERQHYTFTIRTNYEISFLSKHLYSFVILRN